MIEELKLRHWKTEKSKRNGPDDKDDDNGNLDKSVLSDAISDPYFVSESDTESADEGSEDILDPDFVPESDNDNETDDEGANISTDTPNSTTLQNSHDDRNDLCSGEQTGNETDPQPGKGPSIFIILVLFEQNITF